jgi:hypothetical protein
MTTYTLPGRLSQLYPGLSFSSKGGSHLLSARESRVDEGARVQLPARLTTTVQTSSSSFITSSSRPRRGWGREEWGERQRNFFGQRPFFETLDDVMNVLVDEYSRSANERRWLRRRLFSLDHFLRRDRICHNEEPRHQGRDSLALML